MRTDWMMWMACGAAMLVLIAGGCSKQVTADSELTKAANALEKTPPAPAPAPAPQPLAEQAPPPQTEPTPAVPPAQQMKQALAAYKGGQLEDAVTRLQRLRATPSMTPQQRIALNDAMAAVMTEIYDLAAKGDARAKQAVAQYERMQAGRQ